MAANMSYSLYNCISIQCALNTASFNSQHSPVCSAAGMKESIQWSPSVHRSLFGETKVTQCRTPDMTQSKQQPNGTPQIGATQAYQRWNNVIRSLAVSQKRCDIQPRSAPASASSFIQNKVVTKRLLRHCLQSLKRISELADLGVAQLCLSLMVIQLVLGPEEQAQEYGELGPRAVLVFEQRRVHLARDLLPV